MEQHFLQGGFGKNPIFFGKFRKIYMQGKNHIGRLETRFSRIHSPLEIYQEKSLINQFVPRVRLAFSQI
jgi:hypothetical protein